MSKEETKLIATESKKTAAPAIVEAEKLFDRLSEITKETAARAYDFFLERGSRFGHHLEDWLRAEYETLRAAPVKITQSGEITNVMVAVPGFKADEIEVSIKDNLLIVSGETSSRSETNDENIFYNEWQSDRFLRKLVLPEVVDADGVQATVKDGILKLTLTKKAQVEAAKVAVKGA